MPTKIEWTDAVWNPTTGCSKVGKGCQFCYAEREWKRLKFNPKTVYHNRKFTEVQTHPDRLEIPLHWKQPKRIFVNSMSDLFHEDIPTDFIRQVFFTMLRADWHTFQVLTKRLDRMSEFVFDWQRTSAWPLPNVWLGVSVPTQEEAERDIPKLLAMPAARRFLSLEPLLGPVDLSPWLWRQLSTDERNALYEATGGHHDDYPLAAIGASRIGAIDWCIVGGESGPKARPVHPDWVRAIRDQCRAAGVPFFFKQWGRWTPRADEAQAEHLEIVLYKDGEIAEAEGKAWHEAQGWKATKRQPVVMTAVGKKVSGRTLDGQTWEEFPV